MAYYKILDRMNEIYEYRKASAEALGYTWCLKGFLSVVYDKDDGSMILWEPDEDANQREMIEDFLLREHGLDILMRFEQDSGPVWLAEFWRRGRPKDIYVTSEDKSKPIAFMKAFMEYQDTS